MAAPSSVPISSVTAVGYLFRPHIVYRSRTPGRGTFGVVAGAPEAVVA